MFADLALHLGHIELWEAIRNGGHVVIAVQFPLLDEGGVIYRDPSVALDEGRLNVGNVALDEGRLNVRVDDLPNV